MNILIRLNKRDFLILGIGILIGITPSIAIMFLFCNQSHYQEEAIVTANVFLEYNGAGVEDIGYDIYDDETLIESGFTDSNGLVNPVEILSSYIDFHIDYMWQGILKTVSPSNSTPIHEVLPYFQTIITFTGLTIGNEVVTIFLDGLQVLTPTILIVGVLTIEQTQVGEYTFQFVDYDVVDSYTLDLFGLEQIVSETLVVTANS